VILSENRIFLSPSIRYNNNCLANLKALASTSVVACAFPALEIINEESRTYTPSLIRTGCRSNSSGDAARRTRRAGRRRATLEFSQPVRRAPCTIRPHATQGRQRLGAGTSCTRNLDFEDLVAKLRLLSPLAINQVPSCDRMSKCWWKCAASGDKDDYVSFKEGPGPSSVSPPPRACTRPPLSPVFMLLRIPSNCSSSRS
jgi:hypothetical protein